MKDTYLLLPRLDIHNANALSSAVTIGFPAMTAWLGFVHALQRRIASNGYEIEFSETGVCCHDFKSHTYRGSGDYVNSIIGTANPLDKDGKRQSFIEEPRCRINASILTKVTGLKRRFRDDLIKKIQIEIHKMKIAGGDIIEFTAPSWIDVTDDASERKTLRCLMPGHVLIERRELLADAMNNGADALDGLLDYLSVKHRSEQDDEGNVKWTTKRKSPGWIIPIATGFQGLTPLAEPGETKNVRDVTVPHRFAEAVVTLGEFIMPYRLKTVDDFMWKYHYESSNDLYLCTQEQTLKSMKEIKNG